MNIELLTRKDLEDLKSQILDALNNQSVNSLERWLRAKDAMELLGISSSKLQKMRINGQITFTTFGGMYYYDRQDIHKMMDQNRVPCKHCK
jgi:hypothetical protein